VVNIDEQAQKIIGDPDYLKRIISNLVLNAVQAMPNGGTLTVNSIRDKQSGELVLTVEDTGVGIPDDVKDKLFTPMFTTKSKGQGFGLAVVKRMTETLGGSVTFESEHGRGTKFTVRFFPPQGAKG
jgi:two-component system NtrC family sensor kinase